MKRILTAFKEYKEFHDNRHWDANILRFPRDIVTPPHYADTVEILVNHSAVGDIHIGGRQYKLTPNTGYFISPNTVHSVFYPKNDGYIMGLKINHVTLKKYLDLEAVLASESKSFDTLPPVIQDFEAVCRLEYTLDNSDSLCEVCREILDFFGMMIHNSSENIIETNERARGDIRKIIEWSENNFMKRPTVSDAAAVLGYNKNYFCKLFKTSTGVTYLNYLNTIRIEKACTELKNGTSVADVCYLLGFENPSYFIKLFRNTMGVTPKKYSEL